jgi:hypothetical protein
MNLDYDISGLLGLRLVDPTPSLASLVARQLDPLQPHALKSEPDVSISRLAPAPPDDKRFRLGDAGDSQECEFGDSDFVLIKRGGSVSIPFDAIGSNCNIAWSGGGLRRLLIDYVRPALQLSLLPRGSLALHSAAVSHAGKGILLAGWAESGKTEAMMGFLQAGASFVSDKWTIVDADGPTISHFPTPITVRNWMIDLVPGLRGRLTNAELVRARAAGLAASVLKASEALDRAPLMGGVKGLTDLAGRVSVTPTQLLGKNGDARGQWRSASSAPLGALFMLLTTGHPTISVRPAEVDEVARRLAGCARYERRAFFGLYERFKYAFPSRLNPLVEEAPQMESRLLGKALASKPVFVVETPFPFNPSAIFEAIQPFC